MSKRSLTILALAGCATVAFAIAIQGVRVTMNGKPYSGRMVNGSVYVKLTDVGNAFGQTVVAKGGGYDLVAAGGASMLQGTKGKIGEELFTGKWKFLVKEVQRTDSYMLKHADSKFEYTSSGGDKDLVVVHCRFKNAVNKSVHMYFNGLQNTSITDMNEQSYKPKWMDVGGGVASMMLPGSAKEFAIVFEVAESAEIKDLIYTVEPVTSEYGMVDLRISLK
jgi:hypothetical protein